MNHQTKLLFTITIIILCSFCIKKEDKSNGNKVSKVNLELDYFRIIIQNKIGKKYKIISKNNIYFEKNKNFYYSIYKEKQKNIVHYFPIDKIYYKKNKEWFVACSVVNVENRNEKAAIIILKSSKESDDYSISQIIWKNVYDLFPYLSIDKNGDMFLLISYKAETDWDDSYLYSSNKFYIISDNM